MKKLIVSGMIACFVVPIFMSEDADAAFGRRKAIYNVVDASFTTSSGQELTVQQVGEAIKDAAWKRDWNTTPESDTSIEARILVNGRHVAIVRISYTTTSFSIQYRDSEVLLYEKEDGKIHKNYNKWIIQLEEEIIHQLNAL